MKNSYSGAIYSSLKDEYIKIFSIDSRVNFNEYLLLEITQALPYGSIETERLNVFLGQNGPIFSTKDISTNIRFRCCFSPKEYTDIKQYIVGDTVLYKGNSYVLVAETVKGTKPDFSGNWKAKENWINKTYSTNSLVLYSDGKMYTNENSTSDEPTKSNAWKVIKGEYKVYAGIIENATKISVNIIEGNEDFITLYPGYARTSFTLDSIKDNINGSNVLLPVIKSRQGDYVEGYTIIKAFTSNKLSKKVLTSKATPDKKHCLIATLNIVKNSTVLLNFDIQSSWSDYGNPIYGKVAISISGFGGSNLSAGASIGCLVKTEGFSSENLNIEVFNRDNENRTVDIYLVSETNKAYLVSNTEFLVMDKENELLNLGCAFLELGEGNLGLIGGTKLTNLF